LLKYTPENIEYYFDWIRDILLIEDPRKLKYCDESHFTDRLLFRSKSLARRNHRANRVRSGMLGTSFSLTLLINLCDEEMPFHLSLRESSNTDWDFYSFIEEAIEAKSLVEGDFLVCDNASIHFSDDTWKEILDLLKVHGIELLFLPAYSPELNPCELVFGYVKSFIRNNRYVDSLNVLMDKALCQLPYDNLILWYARCINVYERYIAPKKSNIMEWEGDEGEIEVLAGGGDGEMEGVYVEDGE